MTRTTRSLLADLAPPIALRLARKLAPNVFRAAPSHRIHCSGIFASYDEASRAAGQDYEDHRIVDAVYEKTRAFQQLLHERPLEATTAVERISVTLQLVGSVGPELRVIDFGGAFGTHYWIAKALLGDRIRLRWHVVETPAMCKRAAGFANEELVFHDSLEAAMRAVGEPDLVYSDGVLQALSDPLGWLHRLADCRARFLCVRRIGTTNPAVFTVLRFRLSDHEPEVPLPSTVVDAPTPIPMTYLTRASVETALQEHYAVRVRFGNRFQVYRQEEFTIHMIGYFCERR